MRIQNRLLGLISLACFFTSTLAQRPAIQPLPLSAQGRWIVDADNKTVPYVGINWPGAAEVMIPEGLQYQSISSIVAKTVETGFNAVRLTFAIELVDDILDNGGDVSIQDALEIALGEANGTIILGEILKNNPQFTASTTRLQVYDAIANELASNSIYLHLDNHVSKGFWCCSLTDGNSWFGDTYFNTTNWIRGLSYMAAHGKTNWPTFSSIGLRNELRPSLTFASTLQPYTWSTWKKYMTAAATSVHAANPDILIFLSGLDSDLNIEPAVGGSTLLDLSFSFLATDYPWVGKMVFEMHRYDLGDADICSLYEDELLAWGADATTKTGAGSNRAPLVWTEWGHEQSDTSGAYKSAYSTCLGAFMVERQVGWMLWVLAGSYYVRDGVQDSDETYGLLDHDWSGYRGNASLAVLKELIQATYAGYGD